jgi:rhamnopyranosyl-N-acetylglucosaminyl-diphospho-decaprenol beta-1,3/1,4-galactofuranosyltransferase
MSSPRVLAAVVTYNRLELLKRCISYLSRQTFTPDILIINNSSKDGTEDYLIQHKIPFVTQPNLGSAGGWKLAIQTAQDKNYDYVWLMDDDGYPDINSLKKLVSHFEPDMAILSSTVVQEQMPSRFVFGFPLLNQKLHPAIFVNPRKLHSLNQLDASKDTYPYAFLFNGALLSVAKSRKIENIDMSYFMYGDEVDYYYRIRQVGRVATRIESIHYHPDVTKRALVESRVYYFIRNTIIINHRYLDMPYIRDVLTVGVALARLGARNGVLTMLQYIIGKNAHYILSAVIDGYRIKMGKKYE